MNNVGEIGKDLVGCDLEKETGRYYYRARYYDPNTGRFASEDPIAFRGGINFYRYVGNSAVNLSDPTGLYQLKGFPGALAAMMTLAINDAVQTLRQSCCAGLDGQKIANAIESATFVYKPDKKDCGGTGPASYLLRLHHEVGIGPTAFLPWRCCRLASTVAHEAVHLIGGSDDQAYGIEKSCFGCEKGKGVPIG